MGTLPIPALLACVVLAGCKIGSLALPSLLPVTSPGEDPQAVRDAQLEVNPPIPTLLRVGEAIKIAVTLQGEDANPANRVAWRTSADRFAGWVVPDQPCEQNTCAILEARGSTLGPLGSATYDVMLTCPPSAPMRQIAGIE